MKRKGMFIILLLAFIVCLAAASVGYFQSKHIVEDTPPVDNTNKIKYVYYLEDVEVTKEEVSNTLATPEISQISGTTSENQFLFSSSSCTNGVTGDFDIEKWEFVPSENKESTCKLYFNKAYYEVTLTITNGEPGLNLTNMVKREGTGVFPINPYVGYDFSDYDCSNNKEAAWDKINNKLTISAIMEDVACKVVFKVKTLKMDLTVVNGSGNTTETAEYGKSVSAITSANTGFDPEQVDIKCTNEQVPTFSNNTLSIEKLTSDTLCTVTYKKAQVEEYSLEIRDTIPYTIKVTSGSLNQKVKKGDVGQFTLKADTGYSIKNVVCYKTGTTSETVTPSIQDNNDGSKTYSFIGMSKNITCEVTAE